MSSRIQRRAARTVKTASQRVLWPMPPLLTSVYDAGSWNCNTNGMPLPFAEPPASLCIVRLSAIGDTCHTVPVVRTIQDTWPSTKLTWIVGKTEHSLLAGLEDVEFVVLDKGLGFSGYTAV